MSLLARLFAPRAEVITTSQGLEAFLRVYGSGETDSGAVVTPETAMRVAAVYSCVGVVSQDIAALPLLTYRRTGRSKERASDHWLYRLLHDTPNPWQTAHEFRELMQAHVELSGNAYAIKTVVRDETRELLPISPARVTIEQRPDWTLVYHVEQRDGTKLPVPAERMFHLRGLSLDGVTGVSPISYQREAIGLAMQMTRHGARLFKHGAQIGGVLEHPGKMSDDAYRRLRDSFDSLYAGADNAHKTALLEEGVKYSKTALSNRDAEFLESRKLSRSEIAGIFRIPPHKIGDLTNSTFSNIEEQAREYISDALLPRISRWESRILHSLVPPKERATLFSEFLVDGLQRGRFAERIAGYQTAVLGGWMSRNEVRELENLNPADGLDAFLEPISNAAVPKPADAPPAPAKKQQAPPPDDGGTA